MMIRKLFGLEEEPAPEKKNDVKADAAQKEEPKFDIQLEDDPTISEDDASATLDEGEEQRKIAELEAAEAAEKAAQTIAEEEAAKKAAEEVAKEATSKTAQDESWKITDVKIEKKEKKEKHHKDKPKLVEQKATVLVAPQLQTVVKHVQADLTSTSASIHQFLALYQQKFTDGTMRAHRQSRELAEKLGKAANDMVTTESKKAEKYARKAVNRFVDTRLGHRDNSKFKFSPTLSLLGKANLLPDKVQEHPKLESYFKLK